MSNVQNESCIYAHGGHIYMRSVNYEGSEIFHVKLGQPFGNSNGLPIYEWYKRSDARFLISLEDLNTALREMFDV